MKRACCLLMLLVVLMVCTELTAGASNHSENSPNQRYRIPEVTGKVNADGFLKEELWQGALALELEYEVEPGENITPKVKTEVLVAYGKTHFYVAFRAHDPRPSQIRARVSDRDKIDGHDWVGIVLDTFNDDRRSFDFRCNPYGVQGDFITSVNGSSSEWDAIWHSGGRLTGDGYVVEMSIPFSSLRFQRSHGDQVWGFDAVRNYPREVMYQIGLFPRDRNNNCYLCQSVKLEGFAGATPGKNIEFDPTLSAIATQERPTENPNQPFENSENLEAGLTARWGLTPNLILSATMNPDFSHVEADSLKLDINEPFALSYPETRPFFIEGSNFFTPTRVNNIVYTRTLRDPLWGVKLTGKEGANTLGAYVVRDAFTNLLLPGTLASTTETLDMESTATVFNYHRDFSNRYAAGVLFSNRQAGDYYNRMYGAEADLRFSPRDRFQVLWLKSDTRYPEGLSPRHEQPVGEFSGRLLDLAYAHVTRSFDLKCGYRELTPGFRNDNGLFPRVGFDSLWFDMAYRWYGQPDDWWTRFSLWGGHERLLDENGDLMIGASSLYLTYMGPGQVTTAIGATHFQESYSGQFFDSLEGFIDHSMALGRDMAMGLKLTVGEHIDYWNVRHGKRVRLIPHFQWYMGVHMKLNFMYTYEQFRRDAQALYTANQSELRLVYQFNKRTFLRAIMQYVDYRYNTKLYLQPRPPAIRNLLSQFLFSFKLNPQTVLFLGYSDRYQAFAPGELPQINRTVFLKLGYALVL